MLWQPTRGILQPNQHWRRGQGGVVIDLAWDSANKGADITLTNSDKTASKTTGNWNSCLATAALTNDLSYFEIGVDAAGSGGTGDLEILLGFALNDQTVSSYLTFSGSAAFERLNGNGGTSGIFTYANNPPTYTIVNGDTGAWAINKTTGKAWFAYNNTYGGDPVAGTGPDVTWTPAVLSIFPALGLNADHGSKTATLRTTGLTYSPPTGFTAG